MVPPADDGASPAPIDRAILEYLRSRLSATEHVERAAITDESGHLELLVVLAPSYYPARVDTATLSVRWYTNDDFKIHYRERRSDGFWECRWDRHRNPHNSREHFHPPPTASTQAEDDSWPADHRDVLSFVMDRIEERIADLWTD